MAPENTKAFIGRAIRAIAASPSVLDMGGGERFGKWMQAYKDLFDSKTYKTFDFDESTGADIIGDIHTIPLPDNSTDAIICSSVLEHVRDPLRAVGELRRVLKIDGLLFLYVPSTYPYHARKGHYPDYWRFFDDTLQELLHGFSSVEIKKNGGYFTALSFFIPLQQKFRFFLDPIAQFFDWLFNTERRSTTAGYYVLAKK